MIAILANSDSRLKWADYVTTFFPFSSIRFFPNKDELFLSNLESFKIIICLLGADDLIGIIRKLHSIFEGGKQRPIIVTGFPGITDPNEVHGLLSRLGADIICINSVVAMKEFKARLALYGVESDSLLCTGFPRFQLEEYEGVKKDILFVCQSTVPNTLKQREYILQQLYKLASENPEKIITLAPRCAGRTKVTTDIERYSYEDIWKYLLPRKLENIIFDYRPIETLLAEHEMCLTLGSTVGIEAILQNIPTGILTDFGINTTIGNQHFVQSGCEISFERLLQGDKPQVCLEWKKKFMGAPEPTFKVLTEKVHKLLESQQLHPLPFPEQYYSVDRNKYLLCGAGGSKDSLKKRLAYTVLKFKGLFKAIYREIANYFSFV